MALAVAADLVDRPPDSLHPRWAAQLSGLALPVVAASGWLRGYRAGAGFAQSELVEAVVATLVVCESAGTLAELIPPPGSTAGSRGPGCASGDPVSGDTSEVDDRILAKVRSLLAQAESTTFEAEAAASAPGSTTRSRGFRKSFLMAYTHRINARLAEISATVEADATRDDVAADDATCDGSASLLPVLVERRDAIDTEVDAMFGELSQGRVSGGTDALGWARGRAAADRAQLNLADLEPPA